MPGVRPWSWTRLGGGFDRLPGVVVLELGRAQITERGMESASVVNLVDEAGKISCHILEGFVVHQIDGLDLQCLHEALCLGIVVGVPRRPIEPTRPWPVSRLR